ncbi:Glycoside Hydrolase Family 24 protein [Tuber magnatum]|uniref:Glycoside Hydrolase Family 24 protein n=1 Tax=Tuber magnatum TaxID=42249 RepID=A0A317SEW8_9PEZI|nr:Glycoside Hydrolase Family 24 protein [Tuber magnatum]
MKSSSLIGLCVSTLVVGTSAIPHSNSIFGRTAKDACYTQYGEGRCQRPKSCNGILVGGKYCGGGYDGDYETQCCVELVCKVPTGTGYCRSVKNGGCPGGSFQYSDHASSEWPCTGGDIQCCIPGQSTYPPSSDSDTSSSNSSSEYPGGNGRIHKKAIEMLKDLEGFRGEIYKDQVGVDTIGYGHNCATAPGTCESLKTPISEKEAQDLMMKDLKQFEKCICDLPNSEGLSSNEFCAMVRYALFFVLFCFALQSNFNWEEVLG